MPSTKQFDVEDARRRALETFWEHGYEATSMSMLLERMGIQKGSFYATFTSKRAIYLEAMRQYERERFADFESRLAGLAPLEAIDAMLALVQTECTGKQCSRGCMILNAALELAPTDDEVGRLVRESLTRHEKLLTRLIKSGQQSGDIDADVEAPAVGRAMLGMIIGMRVYARSGMPPTYAAAMRAQAMSLLGRE